MQPRLAKLQAPRHSSLVTPHPATLVMSRWRLVLPPLAAPVAWRWCLAPQRLTQQCHRCLWVTVSPSAVMACPLRVVLVAMSMSMPLVSTWLVWLGPSPWPPVMCHLALVTQAVSPSVAAMCLVQQSALAVCCVCRVATVCHHLAAQWRCPVALVVHRRPVVLCGFSRQTLSYQVSLLSDRGHSRGAREVCFLWMILACICMGEMRRRLGVCPAVFKSKQAQRALELRLMVVPRSPFSVAQVMVAVAAHFSLALGKDCCRAICNLEQAMGAKAVAQ